MISLVTYIFWLTLAIIVFIAMTVRAAFKRLATLWAWLRAVQQVGPIRSEPVVGEDQP